MKPLSNTRGISNLYSGHRNSMASADKNVLELFLLEQSTKHATKTRCGSLINSEICTVNLMNSDISSTYS